MSDQLLQRPTTASRAPSDTTPEAAAGDDRSGRGETGPTVADILRPALDAMLPGGPPIQFRFWDGSTVGRDGGPGRAIMRSPDAVRQLVAAPGQLGFARAYVLGDVDVEGPLAPTLHTLLHGIGGEIRVTPAAVPALVRAAHALDAIGRPPPPPPEEARPHGIRHSIRRDKQAVSHHYDVGNDFYEMVLGPSMTYSCARFETPDATLEDAQRSKHLLIARKLGLDEPAVRAASPGDRPRLLDVGCGWGSLAIDVAGELDVDVVGVTISDEQAARARERVRRAGLEDRVEIRIQDYRKVSDGPYDAISSVGMAEHVGRKRMGQYFDRLHELLRPGARLLNHAISSVGGSRMGRRSFIHRYVFPDGELLDVGDTVMFMERSGFEVRDVESLREHYAWTLQHWVRNLERHWDEAVALVGERRARVWRLYMSASVNGFLDGGIQIHQTLGVRARADGTSDLPRTRAGWG